MTSMSVSVDIDAPAETTWQVVTDWERQDRWIPMTDVRLDAGSAAAGGARISARTALGPLGFLDQMVVDVWEPPYRCEVRHLGTVVTGRGVFLVEDRPGGRSRFTWREELSSTGPRTLFDLATVLPTRVLFRLALSRLARLVEAQAREASTQ
jgi:hypothetical protein